MTALPSRLGHFGMLFPCYFKGSCMRFVCGQKHLAEFYLPDMQEKEIKWIPERLWIFSSLRLLDYGPVDHTTFISALSLGKKIKMNQNFRFRLLILFPTFTKTTDHENVKHHIHCGCAKAVVPALVCGEKFIWCSSGWGAATSAYRGEQLCLDGMSRKTTRS